MHTGGDNLVPQTSASDIERLLGLNPGQLMFNAEEDAAGSFVSPAPFDPGEPFDPDAWINAQNQASLVSSSHSPPPHDFPPFGSFPLDTVFNRDDLTQEISFGELAEIHVYREQHIAKLPSMYRCREITMQHAAGDCAVQVLGRIFSADRYNILGFIMPKECPVVIPQNEESRLAMMDCILRLVHDLHAMDIVHGDIKLENLLMCSDGKIRFCDFGNSTFVADEFTLIFSAPLCVSQRQLLAPSAWTKNDDLYALGYTLYEVVHGTRAYPHVDLVNTEEVIMDGGFPDVTVIQDDRARQIISACFSAVPKWAGEVPLDFERRGRYHAYSQPAYPRARIVVSQDECNTGNQDVGGQGRTACEGRIFPFVEVDRTVPYRD